MVFLLPRALLYAKRLSAFHSLFLSSSGNIFHPNPGISYGIKSPGYFKRCASHEGSHSITSQALVYLIKSYSPDWGGETQNGQYSRGREAGTRPCCGCSVLQWLLHKDLCKSREWPRCYLKSGLHCYQPGEGRTGPQRRTTGL